MYLIQVKGERQSFQCHENTNLLNAVGRIGNKSIPVGCRAGGCGVCKIRVLAGEFELKTMSRAQISLAEEAMGYALACRVYPRSNMVVEPLRE